MFLQTSFFQKFYRTNSYTCIKITIVFFAFVLISTTNLMKAMVMKLHYNTQASFRNVKII